jgi:hypothetical protein
MQESFSLNRVGVSPLASSPGVGVVVVSLSHQRGKKSQIQIEYSFNLINGKKESLETAL